MSKIAAVPSLNKKGDTVLQPVKVQRYRRGQAPVGASHNRSDDDDDDDDDNESEDVTASAGATDPSAGASDSEHGLAFGGGTKSMAVSRTLGFASSSSAVAKGSPRKAYVAIDVSSISSSTAAANAAAAAASDPRLRRLAALATSGNQRRRARTTSSESSGSESSEDERDVAPSRSGRLGGPATLEAQAERRLLLQQQLLEAEAQAAGRMKGGKAVGEDGSGSGSVSGSGSEDESSEDSSSDEEEEDAPPPAMRIKPKFVPKFQRKTVPDTAAQLHESTTHPSATTSAARRAESRALVQSEIQRAQTELAEHAQAISAVDDTDDLDPAAEYAAWRERELARLRRALEQRRAYEAEQAELERRRNMTAEERAQEAERVARERQEAQLAKPKVKFMQKYYHKGAFYVDNETVGKKDARGVLQRDASEARPDHFNYEVLPEVMQRKNFGLAGQTKWTHLAKEDTSNKRDAGWFKDKNVVERMEKKRGGMGDVDGGLARKRNRGN